MVVLGESICILLTPKLPNCVEPIAGMLCRNVVIDRRGSRTVLVKEEGGFDTASNCLTNWQSVAHKSREWTTTVYMCGRCELGEVGTSDARTGWLRAASGSMFPRLVERPSASYQFAQTSGPSSFFLFFFFLSPLADSIFPPQCHPRRYFASCYGRVA